MRTYAHIVAIILALALVAKPCASVLAAAHKSAISPAPATQPVESDKQPVIGLKTTEKCKTSCLKGRIESFVWRAMAPKRKFRTVPAPALHVAQAAFLYRDAVHARSRAGPGLLASAGPARELLQQLCRRLT